MSRFAWSLLAAALLLAVSIHANASMFTRFCFQWKGEYIDAGYGEDSLNIPTGTTVLAKGTKVKVTRTSSPAGSLPIGVIFDDFTSTTGTSAGCTDYFLAETGDTFSIIQRARARLSVSGGNIDVFVIEDGADWGTTNNGDYENFSLGITLAALQSSYTFVAPALTSDNAARTMPVVMTMMDKASTLNWPASDLWISTDSAVHAPLTSGCGAFASHYYNSGTGLTEYYVCARSFINNKYNISHEIGHCISRMNDGPLSGSYAGSEGAFAAGNRCDCSLTGNYSHCTTSREFTAAGYGEGFAHFMATATMNGRDTTAPNTGVWVSYKNLREPTADHYDDYTTVLEDPSADGNSTTAAPYGVNLKSANNVRWVNYECNPASSSDPDVSGHYTWFRGNEWDWAYFFWNLWTSSSSTTRYDIDEIEDIWDNVNTSTQLCCDADDECNTYFVKGVACSRALPYTHTVGKPWADLALEAYALYGATKGARFTTVGSNAGVSD